MHNESGYSPSFLIQNGALVERGVAGVSLNDGAIVSGQGAFETLAVYQGQPFLVEAHLKRLSEAAERLGLSCPSDPVLSEAIGTAIRANDLEDASMARVRITLTSPPQGESWIVEATLPPHHPESARLITIPYVRNERGALFGNTQDQLCEGTWSNVFIFVEGHYLTPPLSSGCLPGVTRQIVREILGELDLSCAESDFPMNRLGEIDGAFLTSSLREIQPAASLDGRSLELPPGLTEIKAAFRNRVARGA
jgi:branched-chain amino acid aminotransferase